MRMIDSLCEQKKKQSIQKIVKTNIANIKKYLIIINKEERTCLYINNKQRMKTPQDTQKRQ